MGLHGHSAMITHLALSVLLAHLQPAVAHAARSERDHSQGAPSHSPPAEDSPTSVPKPVERDSASTAPPAGVFAVPWHPPGASGSCGFRNHSRRAERRGRFSDDPGVGPDLRELPSPGLSHSRGPVVQASAERVQRSTTIQHPRREPLRADLKEDMCSRICPGAIPQVTIQSTEGSGSQVRYVTVALTTETMLALLLLASLACFGVVHVWSSCTRHRCRCRMCSGGYKIVKPLGAGGYGEVFLLKRKHKAHPLQENELVGKKIRVHNITEAEGFAKEAKDLLLLRHKHIVSYEDDFVHTECYWNCGVQSTFFWVLMEYCPEGDLKLKIESEWEQFTVSRVRTWFLQLCQAVQYLHSKNVIHRDLKSQNIFLTRDGDVRLGDFGLCRRTVGKQDSTSMSHAGTDAYMAPEIFSCSKYGKPVDVWSLGCVLFELCCGVFMWELDGIPGVLAIQDPSSVPRLVEENTPRAAGSELKSLMKRLLNPHPDARPTITDVLRKKALKKRSKGDHELPFGTCDESGSEPDFADVDATGFPYIDHCTTRSSDSSDSEVKRHKKGQRRRLVV
mmetsp:Transcript_5276/g.12563  ORF Transcript_5276/g.12563 Transcript_5276/m.12563 type:complete len:562 (-) Transcript_5276:148-1833(-)